MRNLWLCLLLCACSTRPLDGSDGGARDAAPAADLALLDMAGRQCGGLHGISCPTGSFCELSSCGPDSSGVCKPQPDLCAAQSAPQCGCDGITYSNECLRQAAGASLDHDGACGKGDACSNAGGYCAMGDLVPPMCKPGYAEFPAGTASGVCGTMGICCAPLGGG
jgi:hypothetical protein